MKQISVEQYDFTKYVDKLRWNSYYNQLKEFWDFYSKISEIHGKITVLYVGKGDNIVVELIKLTSKGKAVVSVCDFDANLKPDYCCDVRELSDKIKEKYDIVFCCQVLEHLPYEYFSKCLRNLMEVCKHRLVISLPLRDKVMALSLKREYEIFNFFIPLISDNLKRKIFKWRFNGEHYWEMNTRGFSLKKVRTDIKYLAENGGGNLIKDYTLKDNPYHHFFIIES